MSRLSNLSPLVERFQKWLSNCKSKSLSYDGRLTLLKSVLGNLCVFFFSTFKAPTTIIKKLESTRRNFIWGGNLDEKKMAWIAWDKVIAHLNQGGLGIGSLKISNQEILAKWWWPFLLDDKALWIKIIVSIHGHYGGLRSVSSPSYKVGPWHHIIKLKEDLDPYGLNLESIFKCKVECMVIDRAPRPTAIVSPPLSLVTAPSLLPLVTLDLAWSRPIRSHAEQNELQELNSLLSNLSLSSEQDTWEFTVSDNRLFRVKSLRCHITTLHYPLNSQPFWWNETLPIKINILTWRIQHKRLPTCSNLDRRGIDLNSTRCPVCDNDIKKEEHLFIPCNIAKETWLKCSVVEYPQQQPDCIFTRCCELSGSSLAADKSIHPP
ncbi:reverse transcriptase domain, reverse transcriptase zinc-binding domain protein [Tanacetum coccineum]